MSHQASERAAYAKRLQSSLNEPSPTVACVPLLRIIRHGFMVNERYRAVQESLLYRISFFSLWKGIYGTKL